MKKFLERGLTSFDLKILGIILMVCDHIHQMFAYVGAPMWLTMLGRIVAPIFLFLSAEGYHYTRNRKRYMLSLLFGFILCNVLFNVVSTLWPNDQIVLMNSIFGTLFWGTVMMWVIDGFRGPNKYRIKATFGVIGSLIVSALPLLIMSNLSLDSPTSMVILKTVMIVVPSVFLVEGGWIFIALAGSFYALRNHRKWQLVPLILVAIIMYALNPSGIQWMMIFAALPLSLYNGQEGHKDKRFFYIFYPAHIIILYIISTLFFGQ